MSELITRGFSLTLPAEQYIYFATQNGWQAKVIVDDVEIDNPESAPDYSQKIMRQRILDFMTTFASNETLEEKVKEALAINEARKEAFAQALIDVIPE